MIVLSIDWWDKKGNKRMGELMEGESGIDGVDEL
jgi:hypothetical protein